MTNQLDYLGKKIKRSAIGLLKRGWDRAAFYLHAEFPDEILYTKSGLFFKKLNIGIQKDQFHFIIQGYPILRLLENHGKVVFQIQDDKFFILWNDLKLNPTTAEEIFIIQEIFVCGTYDFQCNYNSLAVIDIGMNVAFASLFFASKHNVTKVYSFEPFEPTFQQAIANIQYNPDCAAKITTFNYGLSDATTTLEVNYSYENKGQVGIYGTDLIRGQGFHSERKFIQLKSAREELSQIFNLDPTQRFILKVDCEGAEYSIFNELAAHNLLEQVDLIFIEWHERGPEPLLAVLAKYNFKVFHQQSSTKKVGMIYAAR